MTEERARELADLLHSPTARGFRAECGELLREVRELQIANDGLRSLRIAGDYGPERVACDLELAARDFDSSLHETAALIIRRLMSEAFAATDAAADYGDLLALVRRLVGNQDVQCRLDRHGYCQEHNFAAPCPVPEAQRLTGGGTEYLPTCAVR